MTYFFGFQSILPQSVFYVIYLNLLLCNCWRPSKTRTFWP